MPSINIQLIDGSAIGIFTASWLLVIIFDLITMFMVLSLLLEVSERYIVLGVFDMTTAIHGIYEWYKQGAAHIGQPRAEKLPLMYSLT